MTVVAPNRDLNAPGRPADSSVDSSRRRRCDSESQTHDVSPGLTGLRVAVPSLGRAGAGAYVSKLTSGTLVPYDINYDLTLSFTVSDIICDII